MAKEVAGNILRASCLTLLVSAQLTIAPTVCRAESNGGETASLLEHRYYDCDTVARKVRSEEQMGNSACLTFYSVRKDRIAVVLKNPQKSLAIPDAAAEVHAIQQECKVANGGMKLVHLDEGNPKFAIFELKECRSEAEILWLARQLSKLDAVEAAGALARKATAAGHFVLQDDIVFEFVKKPDVPPTARSANLLTLAGLEFIAPDPFNPDHGALLRVLHGDKPGKESPLAGLDLLACAAADPIGESGESECTDDLSTDQLQAMIKHVEDRKDLDPQCAKPLECLQEALAEFRKLVPILVRPTLLPISPRNDEAGFEDWLKGEIKKEDELAARITFNSTSNTTDSQDQAMLAVDASVTKGTYPGQLRFAAGAQVEFDEEKFEENVTKILVNYDHYLRPWIEIYGFVQRFSNSFLSIEQRWEGGGGMLFEYDLRTRDFDLFCPTRRLGNRGYKQQQVRLTKQVRLRMAQYRETLRKELLREGIISGNSAERYCEYVPGISKRNAVWQMSMSLSAISDFEHPESLSVAAVQVDANGMPIEGAENPIPIQLTPPSTQTLRWSLRPMVTWRPADKLDLQAWYYYKLANESGPGGGTDWRSEVTLRANFVLSNGDPKVILTGNYTKIRNSMPPGFSFEHALSQFDLTASDSAARLGVDSMGRTFRVGGFTAERDHAVVKFGVSVSF